MESRNCIYCNEIMTYGPQTQILYNRIMKDGKRISNTVKYVQYGWKCSMKEDDCDIVFDYKDSDANKIIYNEADENLRNIYLLSSKENCD